MSTSQAADDVLVPIQLSSPGKGEIDMETKNASLLEIKASVKTWLKMRGVSFRGVVDDTSDADDVQVPVQLSSLGTGEIDMETRKTSWLELVASIKTSNQRLRLKMSGVVDDTSDADDVQVPVQLSSLGTGENDKANKLRCYIPVNNSPMDKAHMHRILECFRGDKIIMPWPEPRLPKEIEKLIAAINSSSVKSAGQHNIDIDGHHYQNKEVAGTAIKCGFGTSENDKATLRSVYISGLTESELTHLLISGITENGKSKLNSSSQTMASKMNVNFDVKYCQKKEDSYLEVLLMVSSFLLSFASSGAFYFIQALSIVGFHDQLLKHSLVAFKWVFAASLFCNFLGVLTCLILQSRCEYHSFKKFSLIISNTVSFLLMVIGYGLLISFNIQRR